MFTKKILLTAGPLRVRPEADQSGALGDRPGTLGDRPGALGDRPGARWSGGRPGALEDHVKTLN